jgi:NADH:ubiquinone oxidoreductase subunit F (NADH-binding)/NADH:ubiquinone oxidoreductase subunit E
MRPRSGAILRELVALQERRGWLPEADLREIAERLGVPLHRLESVSTFYTHFRRQPPRGRELAVCRDVVCRMADGAAALAELCRALGGEPVEVHEVSCLGRCDAAPAACAGGRIADARDLAGIRAALADPAPRERPVRRWAAADPYPGAADRYATLRAALERDPRSLSEALDAAGLRGMGGAGFPTGRKWALVAAETATPKYVICNADESEPGTFKDREILHDLPHLVIEGMALAGRCVGAARGTVFIRHEYEAERRRLEATLEEARGAGALGSGIFGSAFDFEIDVFVSPGGYILGEETALLECMEDRRGEPRNKPPFPGQRGLEGQPTLINNVETFAHAVGIVARGPEWWRSLGRRGFAGHKFMAVCGDVALPGVFLVPFGTTLGELLEQAGGTRGGAPLAAVAPGGASSRFLPPSKLGVPLDFDAIAKEGSMLGSGAAIYAASGRDLVELGLDVTRFFRNESCGKCVPCRVGTEKAVRLVETKGLAPEVEVRLRELHATLARTSICGLGQVALAPLLSICELDRG